MSKRVFLLFVAGVLGAAALASAQVPAPVPGVTNAQGQPTPAPTPVVSDEEAAERGEDLVERSNEAFFRILRLPKKDFVPIGDNRVRSVGLFGDHVFELVGEDGNDYLIRNLPPEDPLSIGHKSWMRRIGQDMYLQQRAEYYKDKYVIANLDDIYPPFTDKLEFARKDKGLPTQGRWQMSFDVADMNHDGRPDLIMPPMRLGYAYPTIWLQQKDGTWKSWDGLKWPKGVDLDYGAVRVADFDGDGNLDIAIACHFKTNYVLYGDGKGDFTRFVELPRINPAVSSRSLVVADFNRDGRPDVAIEDEINVKISTSERLHNGLVEVLLNLPTGWKVVSDGFPEEIQGDWLSAADLNLDGYPDLLLTSRMQSIRDIIWLNEGKGEKFKSIASLQMPVSSYIFSNATGHFDGFKPPDVVTCFEQFNWQRAEPASQACAVYHFHDAAGAFSETPTPTLFFKHRQDFDNIVGVAVGDLDGDGRDDVAFITTLGEVRLFLQFPDHTLYEERSPEVTLAGATPFDVRIADLDGDGRGEVIICASPRDRAEGGVFVFSPHPRAGARPAKAASPKRP